MHFAFCIFKFFPFGGIQRDMLKILRACQARGHTVTVYTLRWEAPPTDEFEVVVAPIEGLNRHSQYERFAEFVRMEVGKGDYDLVFGFNKMPGLDVYYAGDPCYKHKALEQRPWYYRLLPRYRSFAKAEAAVFDVSSPTRILTLTDLDVPHFKYHYRTPDRRFYALPPGIERDRIAPPEDERVQVRAQLRQEFGLAEDALVFLFVGSGFIKKGLDRALIGFAALPAALKRRAHFFVIGRDKIEAFERMAMRLGITQQVTFFPEGRDDVPRFLFAADALLHPAYDEVAGMVLVEAVLAGLPVLVTKNCGYAKYVSQYQAGMVLPADVNQEEINTAVEMMVTSDQAPVWRANGIAAKHDDTLFEMVPRCVDLLEEFARSAEPVVAFALAGYFPFGGLQRDFMKIALACQAAGFRILVYTMSWEGEVPEGFEVVLLNASANTNHNAMAQFGQLVSEHVRWRQVVCVVGFNKILGLDLYYAADSCFEYKAQDQRNAMYRRTERYRVMSALEQAVFGPESNTHVLFIAPAQIEQFERFYHTPEARTHLLVPGVGKDRLRSEDWQTRRESLRETLGIAPGELMVLLLGSGFVTKGVDRAIEAVASLSEPLRKSVRFFVVGQDHPSKFERQARQLGVSEHVRFLGGRDDVPDLLQAADLMLHPAKMESGGIALVEAVIAGLPVIATANCGFAHYIEDADAGVVVPEPFSQEHLNQVLQSALADNEQRERWQTNGLAYAQAHPELFDMPAQVVDIIQSYHQHDVAV